MFTISRRLAFVSTMIAAGLTVAACSPPSSSGTSSTPAATATSAQALGGMNALIAAARKEGTLNVVSVAPDWANYGAIITDFEQKYGIKVVDDNPEGSSQDEINAAKELDGTSRAPDVFDLGPSQLSNQSMFAPYKVATWNDIPDSQKSPTGLYTQDYGGYMAIGYDSSKVPDITSVDQLLSPAFKGKVALFADPTTSASALTAVMMTSLANGGSLNDIAPGAKFFGELNKAGNFVSVAASNATVQNGTTPVVINWDYLAIAFKQSVPSWKLFIPANAAISSFYNAAINKDAPHPAAARLWTEFLFSNEGQNLFLAGGARPVRIAEMTRDKTIDAALAAKLPPAPAASQVMTPAQATTASSYLSAHWSSEVG